MLIQPEQLRDTAVFYANRAMQVEALAQQAQQAAAQAQEQVKTLTDDVAALRTTNERLNGVLADLTERNEAMRETIGRLSAPVLPPAAWDGEYVAEATPAP